MMQRVTKMQRMSHDDLAVAVMEGLDGVDTKVLVQLHRVLYPKAKISEPTRAGYVAVSWPENEEKS